MSISERLSDDLKKALKAGDRETLSVIRMIKAAVKNREIDKGAALTDDDFNGVLMSLVRQRKESIEQFSKGGRQDLVEKETRELSVLQSYLPQQLSEEELKAVVKNAAEETGANDLKDMGRVMRLVMERVKGRADGRLVSELVKKVLSEGL